MRSGVSLIEAMIGLSLLAGVMMGGTHYIGQMSKSKKVARIMAATEEIIKKNVIQIKSSKIELKANILQVDGDDAKFGKCDVKYYKYSGEIYDETGYGPTSYKLPNDICKGHGLGVPDFDNVTKKLIKIITTVKFLRPRDNELQFYGDNAEGRHYIAGKHKDLNGFMKLPKYRKTVLSINIAGYFIDGVATRMRKLMFYKKQSSDI